MENLSDTTPNDPASIPTEEELAELRETAFAAVQAWIMAMAQAGKTQIDVARDVQQMLAGKENEPG